ncbi:hypothetical protein [Sporosarcina sp. HYO08]|uniref:hypothetical protein n=1 Tax=Sporosarcina sp. HYO08 TaxID=1759557 RepID=UPI000797E42E|nr:hypothetical protein [Sporosarcina sp. HYO08]KXH84003.1 hypothetical protein AU377_04420 [Sporosarcina sp. HYO08]
MHMTVERVSYIHEDEINHFINEITHAFDPGNETESIAIRLAVSIVRKGVIEYKVNTSASEEIVVASLNDVDDHIVRIFFERMETHCTCGKTNWCTHRVAVILHLYSQFHSVTDWLHEWKRSESDQLVLSIAERTPEAWIETLSRLTSPFRRLDLTENPGVFIHECALNEQKMAPLSPFEWEWKPLFELYYRLHLLDAAWPYVQTHLGGNSSSFFYGKWHLKNWLVEQLEKLEDNVHAIRSKPRLFETDSFYEQLKQLVRKFTLGHSALFEDRFEIYRLFWQELFQQKREHEKELAKLQEIQTEEAKVFTAFFYVMQSRHHELDTLIRNTSIVQSAIWLPLADTADKLEDSQALSIIMDALLPLIHEIDEFQLTKQTEFLRRIDGLLEAADFPDATRENLFINYGLASVDVYADFLIERERFAEWSALMHRYQVSYNTIEASSLKVALAKDPTAVFPLLHTYAMRFIQEKNRHSYRHAVRLFKRMKTGSKKSGKIAFWNQYIDAVRDKNRRLRALMEEMEKGNLHL